MRYYIISGEASGDLHGSNLIKAIRQLDEDAEIRAWGGDQMEAAGAVIARHIRELAFMGLWNVIRNLPKILKNLSFCKADISAFKPDVLILIDYSGFNLRVAKWAKPQGFKVFYYISPQVWASRSSRVEKIRNHVDRLYAILPFEKDFYAKFNYDVEYVGHPLLDVISQTSVVDRGAFLKKYNLVDRPIIALLPGSRKQEVSKLLNVLLTVVPEFPDYQFAIAQAPTLDKELYLDLIEQAGKALKSNVNVKLIPSDTYNLLQNANAALVTSGTATLETALFGVPQVVVYRANALFYYVARRIIKVPYISIVNLIMDREIVKELIQDACNTENLVAELKRLMEDEVRDEMQKNYAELKSKLGNEGASLRAASGMLKKLGLIG